MYNKHQTPPTPLMTTKPGSKSPQCKVCSDESSGFHYGVDSCEGCKGFFRRCITQGMTHKCANEEKCEITPFTRNSCQYCRLKKCFAVGMSREASRLGRRPKRLKEVGGESTRSHTANLPIAPYPSPAELYRLRMAELQKLLQANGTFKSELMQAFLSAAQASFREHAKTSTNSLDVTNQNQNMFAPGLIPLSNESGYSSMSSPASSKSQSPLHDTTQHLNNNVPLIENTTPLTMGNYNSTAVLQNMNSSTVTSNDNNHQVMPYIMTPETSVQIKMEPTMFGACEVQDTNANVSSIEKALRDAQQTPSEMRQQLIEQVTEAVVNAHLATCINTYEAVAKANDRLQNVSAQMEMPDLNKLSLSAGSVWQQFLGSMVPEITKVVQFCKKLPGFTEIEQDDQIKLIKQGSFEVLLTRFTMLVDCETGSMLDPTHSMKCPREVIMAMPMGNFFEEFISVASVFNPMKLTDGEIGLFTSVLIMCPDRIGLKNVKAITKIQALLRQSLYFTIQKNHSDADGLFRKLLGSVPMLQRINEQHSKALNNIKMLEPENYEKQFPALHKEVFDCKI